jgi:hypothetical protein
MKGISVAAVLFATALLVDCGGGGGSVPSSATPAIGSSAGIVPAQTSSGKATFTISIPLGSATQSSRRTPQYVAPTTSILYLSLEDSPGHGNATFSYTEQLNSSTCTVANNVETCSFSVVVAVGTETFSILTTDSHNVPLSYSNFQATINPNGTSNVGPPSQLNPIIANVIPAYAFQAIASAPTPVAPVPAVTTTAYDADGNALSLFITGDAPFGDASNTYTATQSVGEFMVEINAHGRIVDTSAAENTFTGGVSAGQNVIVEIGNGTATPFTTTITETTPAVQFTKGEFPTLSSATVSVPASSNAITLTCQFTSSTPATDPCPGTASVTFPIH